MVVAQMGQQAAIFPDFSPLEAWFLFNCVLPCANLITCWGLCDPFGLFS